MRTDAFDYPLPPERIAQEPLEPRDAARLLLINREQNRIEHRHFLELPEILSPGDLLVMNDTRVLPARLEARRATGGRVELLLLRRESAGEWDALVKPGRKALPGERLLLGDGSIEALIGERLENGGRRIRFQGASEAQIDADVLAAGEVPLPPYIHARLEDSERYQTIYAREQGSVAAPTAGLHFTPRVFAALKARGVAIAAITLHVGIATFRPVKAETIDEHEMHEEWYSIPPETARAIKQASGRVISVGTTTARCLESAALAPRQVSSGAAATRLYIRPGYRFQVIDGLLTNFHMPRSTLLILVSALAGHETIRRAYDEALARDYRFLSFGDATLIL